MTCKILMQSHNRQRVWYFVVLSFFMQYTIKFSGTHVVLQPLRTMNWATGFRSHIYPYSFQTCFHWHVLPLTYSGNVLNPHQKERIFEWKNNREKCIAFVWLVAYDSLVPLQWVSWTLESICFVYTESYFRAGEAGMGNTAEIWGLYGTEISKLQNLG